ncbi:MAG: Crp/Fnr family transcriptional regulator [Calditrichaeota bacterium]|nr:MAG: Crp/Fnr family transcriptional regulator [Calditrichota bacterium]
MAIRYRNGKTHRAPQKLTPNCEICERLGNPHFVDRGETKGASQLSGFSFRTFSPQENLFEEGQPANGVYCLYSGNVKILKRGAQNQEHLLRIQQPGQMVGLGVFSTDVYPHTAVAMTSVEACFIPTTILLDVLQEDSTLSVQVMQMLCKEIELIETRLTSFTKRTARERVAETLLDLKKACGTDKDKFLNILLSWEELASYAGTSRATLQRLMNDFKRRNLIRVRKRKIQMLNLEQLTQIAGG